MIPLGDPITFNPATSIKRNVSLGTVFYVNIKVNFEFNLVLTDNSYTE